MSKDAVGAALLDYFNTNQSANITVKSSITEDDVIAVSYLFRLEKELPELEVLALKHCKGKILDVGAASGCHSIILKEKGFNVTAIDVSKGAVDVITKRGIKAQCIDFYVIEGKYDTLLVLMNGIGIAGKLDQLTKFLEKAKLLLTAQGQILIDSLDIKYLFEEEDGSMWLDLATDYYGEVRYQMQYKTFITDEFDWLFVDFETLKTAATSVGLKTELLFRDEFDQYLVKLSV